MIDAIVLEPLTNRIAAAADQGMWDVPLVLESVPERTALVADQGIYDWPVVAGEQRDA
ncbi:hypothetical protein [Amycolatopsis rifamycinica]|uniref:hypothetical protein n=1 Tax=Amycolatopsis rifamycinica TaxID=287986 RepID=UPI000A8065C3|nr:hypothetical protein [Amycolatopsis rifamycinica]